MRNVLHRRLVLVAAVAACGMVGRGSWAQVPNQKVTPGVPRVTTLNLSGSAPTKPALEYQLLPPAQDVEPGNGATRYLSALTLLPKNVNEQSDQVDKYLGVPLAELDEKGAAEVLKQASSALHMAATGARTESADWGTNVRREGIQALLPSLGPLRTLANLQALSIRVEIKAHHWGAARDQLQTGFALARHLGQGETLIESLVGVAIASRMEGCLEDWVQEPGSPNLFWPVVNLPMPFNDLRHPLMEERAWIYFQMPSMRDFEAGRYSMEGWYRLVNGGMGIMNGQGSNSPSDQAAGLAMAVADYPQAKAGLIARGVSASEVEGRPVDEVLERYFVIRFNEISDEAMKWIGIPMARAIPGMRAEEATIQLSSKSPGDLATMVWNSFMPSYMRARFNAARLDRRLTMLTIVEALRASATWTGKFPDSLDGLSLPISLSDPALGKSFVYQRSGDGATLSVVPSENRTDDDEWHLVLKK